MFALRGLSLTPTVSTHVHNDLHPEIRFEIHLPSQPTPSTDNVRSFPR
ncbi:hypothetical protein GCM10010406_52240 [Streptomyces thermolineatus]|uniref:Uncharacterized protein n=1 Tax=Streptomyces thermolineatus TaxID=44033 RepID=A0ABP6A6V6_9ACTN